MKENRGAAALLLAAALVAASAAPVLADGLGSIAKELSRGARRAKTLRVAVLPFKPTASEDESDGAAIAERLTTRIVELGGLEIIERSRLQALMSEHAFERTGAVAASGVKPLGRVAAADAVVTGTFTSDGPRLVVEARLVDMETGVILAAAESSVDRDWADGSAGVSVWVPAPEFIADVPSLDAVAPDPCQGASERIDGMEREVLDLKARYWASKLRSGTSLHDLKENPGSTISDPALRRSFYERLKFWYQQDAVPGLTAAETSRFVSTDGKAYSLYQRCGV